MMRIFKGRIAGRCAVCLMLLAVAAWSVPALVEGWEKASAQRIADEQYQSQLQYHYGHNGHIPIGNVEQLFARVR